MQGDWKVFWNVGGGDVAYNNREALAHGFRLVNLLGTYADYPGKQKENINHALKDNRTNPWKKPDYFERIIRRNYWGVAGKSAQQIDGTHRNDAKLWKYIDPHVDFHVASVYVFYDDPGSIYYIAANVEENCQRTRRYGSKPVYAYEWLRYHDSNKKLAGQELAPYLVEAMAVVPYFCGAKGVVVWGWEPGRKRQYYKNLPLFARSLGRVSDFSERLASAELVIDEPAHILWKEKRPLVRKYRLSEDEWVVLAVDPWRLETEQSEVSVQCETCQVDVPLIGRHTGLFLVRDGNVMSM